MPPVKDGKVGVDRSAMFTAYNTQKYGISLDLNHPGSKEITRRLVTWADIVSDSMTPGTMARWGLDYESCREINPRIIYFSTTQLGQTGPYRDFQGFGHHANALFGLSHATGWPDGEPNLAMTAYSDFVSPWYLTIAVIGALLRRRRTGKGMYIEQSQLEAGLSFMAPHLLDFAVNRRVLGRAGNRDPAMAPHGAFPCRGENRWVAIAVEDEGQWKAFCEVIGEPGWISDPRFSTVAARKANEDDLEARIGSWTATRSAREVMERMQAAGVPAGAVQNAEDLLADPQLEHRRHFAALDHPEIGRHSYHVPAYRLSRTPHRITRPAPCLGQHNQQVYCELLGFSEQELADLVSEGAVTTAST